MSKAFEEIAQEAAKLSREQRIVLASLLLELTDEDNGEVSAVWEREILARIGAVESGTALSKTYEEVMSGGWGLPHS